MPSRVLPKNPFVYGRVLTSGDAACPRPELEKQILLTVREDGRLALVGDRRMGKSSAVQRTLQKAKVDTLCLNYHEVVDLSDVVIRTLTDLERFIRERSPIARKFVPMMREIGVEIQALRAAMTGFELKASTSLQTDHLKRAYGFIRDVAQRAPFALFIDELQDLRDRLGEREGLAALAIIRGETQQMAKGPVFFAGSARESFTFLFTSDSSPFYHQAKLVHVEPIAAAAVQTFVREQFARGHGIDPEAVPLIGAIAGDSPNDIQLLCHETWYRHTEGNRPAGVSTITDALGAVLKDLSPLGEKWLSDLSANQQRLVFAVAFMENIGASTAEFMEFAGVRNTGTIDSSLAATIKGREPLLEKVGSKYRFRSRFTRLWFALRATRAQALIPALRNDEEYRRRLTTLLPPLLDGPDRILLPG